MNEQALVTIMLAIGSWVVSGTITYGFMKAKIADFDRRLTNIENDHRQLQRDFTSHEIRSAREARDSEY